jgi:hypothetical protein
VQAQPAASVLRDEALLKGGVSDISTLQLRPARVPARLQAPPAVAAT